MSDLLIVNEMSPIIASYLHLLCDARDIPVPTLADAVLFVAEEKRALRFTVSQETARVMRIWAKFWGFVFISQLATTRRVAEGWNILEPLDTFPLDQHDKNLFELVVLARNLKLAKELIDCELSGSPTRAGELLDYPLCCVSSYSFYCRQPTGWIAAALRPCAGEAPLCWCNRLPLTWQSPNFVGEIYPCSFRCVALATRSLRVYELLGSFGLQSLAHYTLAQTLRPVTFRPNRSYPEGAATVLVDDSSILPDFLEFSK